MIYNYYPDNAIICDILRSFGPFKMGPAVSHTEDGHKYETYAYKAVMSYEHIEDLDLSIEKLRKKVDEETEEMKKALAFLLKAQVIDSPITLRSLPMFAVEDDFSTNSRNVYLRVRLYQENCQMTRVSEGDTILVKYVHIPREKNNVDTV